MSNLLKPIVQWARPILLIGAGLFIPFALILAWLTQADLANYNVLVASLDAGLRSLFFLATVCLMARLFDHGNWLPRVSAVLAALGVIGALVFTVGALVESAGLIGRPAWVNFLIPMMFAGFIGLISAGIAVLRTNELASSIGMLLLAPPLIFALQFAIMPLLPTWSILIFIGAQAATMLAIGLQLPSEQAGSRELGQQAASA